MNELNVIVYRKQMGEMVDHEVDFEWEPDEYEGSKLVSLKVGKLIKVDGNSIDPHPGYAGFYDQIIQIIEDEQLGLDEAQEEWREYCRDLNRRKGYDG